MKKEIKQIWSSLLFKYCCVGIFCGIGYMLFFMPIKHYGTITRFEWEYSIDLEELRDVEHSGYTLPKDATLKYTEEETETKKEEVPIGKDENGKTITRTEVTVITKTLYHYTQKEYVWITTYVESGFGKEGMKWPSVKLKENQRLGEGKQHFYLYIDTGGDVNRYEVSNTDWNDSEIGGRVSFTYPVLHFSNKARNVKPD